MTVKGSCVTDKHCWFEFSSNVPDCFLRLEEEVKDFPFYAYIHHTADDEDLKEHVHFFIRSAPITIKALSARLDLPANFIRWVRNKRSFCRYLVHLDNPEKIQYSREDIITNDDSFIDRCFSDNLICSPLTEYYDFLAVLEGRQSANEFIQNNSTLITSLSFSSRLKLYSTLYFADKNNEERRNP